MLECSKQSFVIIKGEHSLEQTWIWGSRTPVKKWHCLNRSIKRSLTTLKFPPSHEYPKHWIHRQANSCGSDSDFSSSKRSGSDPAKSNRCSVCRCSFLQPAPCDLQSYSNADLDTTISTKSYLGWEITNYPSPTMTHGIHGSFCSREQSSAYIQQSLQQPLGSCSSSVPTQQHNI